MGTEGENKANAIEKALRILMLFTPHNRDLGTTEISQRLSFHKATVSRILLTLTRHGFLQQDRRAKTFRLGSSALKLGVAIKQSLRTNLVELAKPHVDALRDSVNETTTLEVLSGPLTVLAYLAEGTRTLRMTTHVGATLPLHAAAGAKAVLAFLPPESWRTTFAASPARLTSKTVTDPEVFRRQLQTIREQGFAIDDEEIDEGVVAVAAPVFNHEGAPVAAVAVVGPSDRISLSPGSSLIARLKRAAEEISAELHSGADARDSAGPPPGGQMRGRPLRRRSRRC
ncbi:MAG: IclR family transcriptional regulator [Deltaproteobacteria bacterium]|nr:IclR family transcriptional regulator [Deltaproteobacteria bacterium]